jgi:molecular chaperone GrpE
MSTRPEPDAEPPAEADDVARHEPDAEEEAAEQPWVPPTPEDETLIAELTDRWHRAAADLDNIRKRHAREVTRARAAERDRVAAALLPVLDNLELALAHADADRDAVLAGIAAVRDQAVGVLAQLGYPRRGEPGVPFDPSQHEVVQVVDEPDVAPGTVVEVLRPGYGEADRQLRPAAVAVSRFRE